MTRELASSYGLHGTAVVAVAPGRFDTESLRKYPVELWRSAAATVPLQRLGPLEEYGWLMLLRRPRCGAVRIGHHAGRRARQLVRSVAASGNDS